MRGAFQAEPILVRGKNILIIDDVMTTGTTLHAAARTLLRAGVLRVDALVCARVP